VEWSLIISVISTGIAAIAVIVSAFGIRMSRDTAKRQEESTAVREWRQEVREWRQEVGTWASKAIDVLSEASYACDAMPKDAAPEEYFRLYLAQLWGLIDRGRLLLPNQQPERRPDPVPAFRGYRNAALDPLWAAGNVMENRLDDAIKKDVIRYRRSVLEELQREFISKFSVMLVPEEQVRKLLPDETPPGDKALLNDVVPRVV
jgi:hypothetical protein